MDIKQYMQQLGSNARLASREMAKATTGAKNSALQYIADNIMQSVSQLMAENEKDLSAGKADGLDDGLTPFLARVDVPGRDPAADTLGLERGADGIRGQLVLVGIGNENVVCHRTPPKPGIRSCRLPGPSRLSHPARAPGMGREHAGKRMTPVAGDGPRPRVFATAGWRSTGHSEYG